MDSMPVAFLHVSPPYCTLRPAFFVADETKDAAMQRLVAWAIDRAVKQNAIVTFEHPEASPIWQSDWFATLRLRHVFRVDSSAYGAPRNRRMKWATTWSGLSVVAAACDAPPRRKLAYDIRDEQYPRELVKKIVHLLLQEFPE
eukprot:3263432-Amphidinium_carterae.1